MKAISTIIATIMLVVITISLVSTAYLFVGGILTGSVSKVIRLVDAKAHRLIVRNEGTKTISSDEIKISVNGQQAHISNPQDIDTQDTVTLRFIPPELEMISAKVNVLGPSNSLSYTTDIVPHELKAILGTVGLWHFKEGSGNEIHDETGLPIGTLNGDGDEWTTNCMFSSCLNLDGNDFVEIPLSSSFDVTQLSIVLWIRTPSNMSMTWRNLVSKQGADRDYNFYAQAGTFPYTGEHRVTHLHFSSARFGSSAPALTIPYKPQTWHHVAITVNSTGYQTYYSDGKSFATYQGTAGNANNAYPLWIGRADNYWNGTIDEVVIYDRALSQEEILDSIYG